MGRIVRDWKPLRVADLPVAPHRYHWDNPPPDLDDFDDYKAMKAAIPYSEGEVVYIERGGKAVRALIYVASYYRSDYDGCRRAYFKVQVETAEGLFSKLWEKTWPGFIQRGYQLAGLAPDVDAADATAKAAERRRKRSEEIMQEQREQMFACGNGEGL